jgi:hypothetical protein
MGRIGETPASPEPTLTFHIGIASGDRGNAIAVADRPA